MGPYLMRELGYKTKSELVYTKIMEKIASEEIKPGERISAAEIAKELSVSRTPVNEAMKKLEDNGVIKILPNVGFEVTMLSWQEIQDLNTIRVFLEKQIIIRLQEGFYKEDLENLKKLSLEIQKAIKEGDRRKYYLLTEEWHIKFANMARAKVFSDIYTICWDYGGWDDAKHRDLSDDLMDVNKDHDEMLALIEKGNFEEALRLSDRHSDKCLDLLKKSIDSNVFPGLI